MSNNRSRLSPEDLSFPPQVLVLNCFLITYKYPLYGWQKIIHMAIPVCLALMWFPCMVLNLIALLVYLKKSMRKQVSNLIILNTIIADLCTGLFSIPQGTTHYIMAIYFHKVVCPLYASFNFFGFVCSAVSFLMVSFAGIDRYIAVMKPFFYSKNFSYRSSLYYTIMISTWIFSISIVLSSFFTPGFSPVVYFLGGQLLLIVLQFFINIKVWLTVRKLRKRIGSNTSAQPQVCCEEKSKRDSERNSIKGLSIKTNTQNLDKEPRGQSESPSTFMPTHTKAQLERDNRKSTKVTFFILTSLCICYLPYFIIAIIWKTANEDLDVHNTIGNLSVVLGIFKSVLNPIIYWHSMPQVRKQMKQFLCFWNK